MSDESELKKTVESFDKAVKDKTEQVKQAAEKIAVIRQIQTESPNR